MKTSTEIGVSRPRFTVLRESAGQTPLLVFETIGLFAIAMLPLSLVSAIIGPAPVVIGYVFGVSAFGLVRESQRGMETTAQLVWHTITLGHLALGQLYALDAILATIQHRGGDR